MVFLVCMRFPRMLPPSMPPWIKYLLCVLLLAALAVGSAFLLWPLPDDKPLLILLGAPVLLYFSIARFLGGGFVLLIAVFTLYSAAFLLPLLGYFRDPRRETLWLQAVIAAAHFLLGIGIIFLRGTA